MDQLRFFKVGALPTAGTAEPNAFYLIPNASNANYADTYVTDNQGNLKQIGNTSMISEISQATDTKLSGGVLDGQEMVLTDNKGGEVRFDVSPMFSDIRLQSGQLNAAGDALDFVIGDGTNNSTVSVPVSALVSVAVGEGLTGDGTPSNPLKAKLSTDAGQTAVFGADGGIFVPATATHTHANKTTLDNIGAEGDTLKFNGSAVQRWENVQW